MEPTSLKNPAIHANTLGWIKVRRRPLSALRWRRLLIGGRISDADGVAGLAAGILMIPASKSRMGLVGLVCCIMAPRMLPLVARSWAWLALSGVMASLATWGAAAFKFGQVGIHSFKAGRADSTRVRETLQRIAWERWQTDAVWFGHGRLPMGILLTMILLSLGENIEI